MLVKAILKPSSHSHPVGEPADQHQSDDAAAGLDHMDQQGRRARAIRPTAYDGERGRGRPVKPPLAQQPGAAEVDHIEQVPCMVGVPGSDVDPVLVPQTPSAATPAPLSRRPAAPNSGLGPRRFRGPGPVRAARRATSTPAPRATPGSARHRADLRGRQPAQRARAWSPQVPRSRYPAAMSASRVPAS